MVVWGWAGAVVARGRGSRVKVDGDGIISPDSEAYVVFAARFVPSRSVDGVTRGLVLYLLCLSTTIPYP